MSFQCAGTPRVYLVSFIDCLFLSELVGALFEPPDCLSYSMMDKKLEQDFC